MAALVDPLVAGTVVVALAGAAALFLLFKRKEQIADYEPLQWPKWKAAVAKVLVIRRWRSQRMAP